jgi:hypothetical protein
MAAIGTTYSFKDLSGAIVSPIAGSLVFAGELGAGQVVFINDTEHGSLEKSADGQVMPVYEAGDGGRIEIECLQTSIVHKFLLAWFNTLNSAARNGDVSNWASTTGLFRNAVDGSVHEAYGVSPMKNPDKTYAEKGTKVRWTLLAANLQAQ